MRIVICYPVDQKHLAQLAEAAPGHEIVDAGQSRIAEELLQADVFLGHAKVPVPWPEVVARGRLQWIQSSAAGLDHCLVPSVIDSPIVVTSASGLFADPVAEQTMALLTGLLRGLPRFFPAQQRREFVRLPTRDLHGMTIGIVGFGGNGRRIAEVLAPFRTRILATDLFPPSSWPAHVERVLPAHELRTILPIVETLILCLPLNRETEGLIDRELLSALPRGALLINVARGPIVVESDLVEMLRRGHLGGAGLDVTEVEPLPPSSPLWDMPEVLITPHVGAQSARRADVTTEFLAENLRRFLTGLPLKNVVDKQLGFPRPAW